MLTSRRTSGNPARSICATITIGGTNTSSCIETGKPLWQHDPIPDGVTRPLDSPGVHLHCIDVELSKCIMLPEANE